MAQEGDSNALAIARGAHMGVGCLLMVVVGLAQMAGCAAFLADYWGWPWFATIPVMGLLFFMEAGLLVSIGCFFGAMLVWHWPWWGALFLAAPGVVLFGLTLLGVVGGSGAARLWTTLRGSSPVQSSGRELNQFKLGPAVVSVRPDANDEVPARLKAEVDACKEAIRLKPDSAEAHNNLGRAYHWNRESLADAIDAYKQAIRLRPDFAQAHLNLAIAFARLGRWTESVAANTEAVRLGPDEPMAHYNLGNALEKIGRLPEAVQAFKEAIRLRPDDVETHYRLGAAFLGDGNRSAALDQYKILKDWGDGKWERELAEKLFNQIYP